MMEQQAYFGSIAPQIRTMFTAQFENLKEDLIHKKVSYTYRFILITEGSCTVCFDNYQRLCDKGDLFFLCPHQNYSTTFHPVNFRCINTVFEFSGDPARKPGASEPLSRILYYSNLKPAPELYAEKLNFSDMPMFNSSFIISGMPGAEGRVTKMYSTFCDKSRLARLRLNAALLEFITDVVEYADEAQLHSKSEVIHKILDYIDEHYHENLTCASIADAFSYHPSYINRIVRGYTGYSLHAYIMNQKIQAATRMLLDSDLTITDIAYRLSFCDSSHFSKVYQAHTGIKPSDVRRNCRKAVLN